MAQRQLKNEDRKSLYVSLSTDIYDWVHEKASRLQVSKAMLMDTMLRDLMTKDMAGEVVINKASFKSKSYEESE
jgi:hypothetical protein